MSRKEGSKNTEEEKKLTKTKTASKTTSCEDIIAELFEERKKCHRNKKGENPPETNDTLEQEGP